MGLSLLTGIGWLVFALLVFQWDFTTVYAISFLFGAVALFAAMNEVVAITVSTARWKMAEVFSARFSQSPASGR